MKLLIISLIAAVGLIVALMGIPRTHSLSTIGRAGGSASALQDKQSARSADKLPDGDFDDRSLVFPRESKR